LSPNHDLRTCTNENTAKWRWFCGQNWISSPPTRLVERNPTELVEILRGSTRGWLLLAGDSNMRRFYDQLIEKIGGVQRAMKL